MAGTLDEARLREQADAPHPELFAGIARAWADALPIAEARIREAAAGPEGDLPRALHELRSGAVAVGLPALAGALAALEQRAEAGDDPAPDEVEAALDLARESADALARWWAAQAG